MKNLCIFCQKICNRRFCSNSCSSRFFYENKNRINIDDFTHQIIEGTLFSDAGLELDIKNRARNPRYYFKQTERSKEYVDYIADCFNLKENVKLTWQKGIRKPDFLDYRFKTCNSISLLPYYQRWYQNKVKIIPNDFVVTPTILLHAYLGDGYYRKCWSSRTKFYYVPCFCTDSFKEGDLMTKFCSQLKDLCIDNCMGWHEYKPIKKYPRIIIKTKSVDRFFDYIGKCPVECFKYKWPHL